MIIRLQIPSLTPPIRPSQSPSPPPHFSNPNFPIQSNPNLLKPFTSHKPPSPSSPLLITDSGLLFRQKLIYLEHLKINSTKVLDKNPNIRSFPLESIKSIEKCLYSMGIQESDIGRIFDMYPQLITCDIYLQLYPVFDFLLNDVKIPFNHVRKAIIRCPRLLICSVEDQLRPTLGFLRGLGFVGKNAITSQTTLLLVSNVKGTLVPKIEYIESLGFSHKDVVTMILRSPGLLTFSIANNFQPKVEYFLKEMKGDIVELKRFPQYFSFSLEGKIKPRHRVLVEHGCSLPLSEMLKISEGEFQSRLFEMRMRSSDRKVSL
ncbi:hypothetical protein ACHQM5_006327 [Ranunculus cassubicifolius]